MPLQIKISDPFKLSDNYGYFPTLFKLEDGTLLVGYSTGTDAGPNESEKELIANEQPRLYTAQEFMEIGRKNLENPGMSNYLAGGCLRSTDGGKTFHEWGMPPMVYSMIESNGELIGICFQSVCREGKRYAKLYRSKDSGNSWEGPEYTEYSGPPGSREHEPYKEHIYIHRSIVPMDDGSFLVTAYGRFEGDTHDRVFLLKTTDNFKSLYYYSTVAHCEDAHCNEPVMTLLLGGKTLLCVIRTNGYSPMLVCRSTNGGATWSAPEYVGADGVDPDMCLLQNGVPACSYGRPNVSVMFAEDGSHGFRRREVVYLAECSLVAARDKLSSLSCCYTGLREIAPNRLLLLYSATEDPDTKPIGHSPWLNLKDYRIFGVLIDVEKED